VGSAESGCCGGESLFAGLEGIIGLIPAEDAGGLRGQIDGSGEVALGIALKVEGDLSARMRLPTLDGSQRAGGRGDEHLAEAGRERADAGEGGV